MFQLNGDESSVSTVAQSLLDNSGFFGVEDDELTCVIYRKDPIDGYLFLAAHAGLREPEPMYGPLVEDDRRKKLRHAHPTVGLDFKQRESTQWGRDVSTPNKPWQIWVSGRKKANESAKLGEFESKLLRPLETLLEANIGHDPLFPELWFHERLARDHLHDEFRYLPPGASLEDVGCALTRRLEQTLNGLPENPSCDVGVYLDTGENWTLLGVKKIRRRLPHIVSRGASPMDARLSRSDANRLNAFEWVYRSTRPVLLRRDELSPPWEKRLRNCNCDFADEVTGVCLVPLLDLNSPWLAKGILLLTSTSLKARLRPAHLFLLSRLARDLSGFINPIFPMPGFAWWPDVGIDRGGVHRIEWPDGRPDGLPPLPTDPDPSDDRDDAEAERVRRVERISDELMPTDSRVSIRILKAGYSGAQVFQLGIKDKEGHIEIPRVLKIGDEESISHELKAYHQYVHNKRLGIASRVDIARLHGQRPHQPKTGAIVYTLVGSGETATPWSSWGKKATLEQLDSGIEKLREQMSFWYDNTNPVERSSLDLLIKEPFFPSQHNGRHHKPDPKEPKWKTPTRLQVVNQLNSLVEKQPRRRRPTRTCVVHGDLHSQNLFSILATETDLHPVSVALIDWGSVSGERHPLTDISRIMADLIFHIRWTGKADPKWNREYKWAIQHVRNWSEALGLDPDDWYLAMIQQIAKMLFYYDPVTGPFFEPSARTVAWKHLCEWVKAYLKSAASP